MSVTATIIGSENVQARFERCQNGIQTAITDRMNRITIKLQAHVVRDKLSGQVLRFRTNNLRGSIHQEVTSGNGSIIGMVGTNVEYAARHEYGFQGSETVKTHLRTIRQAFGKPLKAPKQIEVQQFTRNINYPEHSFLRSALADMRSDIMVDLTEGVAELLKK